MDGRDGGRLPPLVISPVPGLHGIEHRLSVASAQVKSALLTHRSTSALKTKVVTRDGLVILSGEARNRAEKDLVTKFASDIHGVKSVVNNMEVKE